MVVVQEREDCRKIRELQNFNEDIENSSEQANFKDCRPNAGGNNSSLLTNLTLNDSNIKSGTKKVNKNDSLAIKKSPQEQERNKKQLVDKHQKHLNKVTIGKQTLQHEGSIYRTVGASAGQASTGGIIKTVILPNEEINRLGVEAEELR